MSTSEAQRGICPACDREYAVTAAGGMRMHLTAGHGLWRGNCEGVGQPPKAMSDGIVAAARREGWAQAIEALRDMERSAVDGSPFQTIADAIADVSYAGKQVTRGHGRYLANAALRAVADYLTDRAAALTEEGT